MSGLTRDSNVYYLPICTVAAPALPVAPPRSFIRRVREAWWRFRLVVADIQAVLRRSRSRRVRPDDYGLLLERREQLQRARQARPARVIDFETARLRMRPAAED